MPFQGPHNAKQPAISGDTRAMGYKPARWLPQAQLRLPTEPSPPLNLSVASPVPEEWHSEGRVGPVGRRQQFVLERRVDTGNAQARPRGHTDGPRIRATAYRELFRADSPTVSTTV